MKTLPATCARLAHRTADLALLFSLVKRLDGRIAKPLAPRRQYPRLGTMRRDPLDVLRRFLRRHTTGPWHQGGHHIARYHGGPGIAIPDVPNNQKRKLRPYLINA
jgi:hypothetical protein